MPAAIGTRALNRALLARQFLLERARRPALDVVEHLVGMQAQNPGPPYIGLWTRVAGFDFGELSAHVRERRAVRIALMRSTIHLVTARDCLGLRPLVQPMIERATLGGYGRRLDGIDLVKLAAAGRALVEERPHTFAELGTRLARRWRGRDPAALAQMVRALLPLVQVPPRGVWGERGQAMHTTAEAWLGAPVAHAPSLDAMVLRYLAAFGPASVRDVQTWCGLRRLRDVLERLRPELVTFRAPDGAELFDLPDAPRPDPRAPAPPRFLPEYDNLLLSHADRTRIAADVHRNRFISPNGMVSGSVLVDGFVRGMWRLVTNGKGTVLEVDLFDVPARRDRAAVAGEAEALLAAMVGGSDRRTVAFTPPDRSWRP